MFSNRNRQAKVPPINAPRSSKKPIAKLIRTLVKHLGKLGHWGKLNNLLCECPSTCEERGVLYRWGINGKIKHTVLLFHERVKQTTARFVEWVAKSSTRNSEHSNSLLACFEQSLVDDGSYESSMN